MDAQKERKKKKNALGAAVVAAADVLSLMVVVVVTIVLRVVMMVVVVYCGYKPTYISEERKKETNRKRTIFSSFFLFSLSFFLLNFLPLTTRYTRQKKRILMLHFCLEVLLLFSLLMLTLFLSGHQTTFSSRQVRKGKRRRFETSQ